MVRESFFISCLNNEWSLLVQVDSYLLQIGKELLALFWKREVKIHLRITFLEIMILP